MLTPGAWIKRTWENGTWGDWKPSDVAEAIWLQNEFDAYREGLASWPAMEIQQVPADRPMIARNRQVLATDIQPNTGPGSWKCGLCGFRGFWRGGIHCQASEVLPGNDVFPPQPDLSRAIDNRRGHL